MKTFRRIDHVALVVSDTVAAAKWYSENYGGEIEYLDSSWSLVSFENTKIAFVLKEEHPHHIAFETKDLKDGKLHRDGSISIYKSDPWGNVIEIVDYKNEKVKQS